MEEQTSKEQSSKEQLLFAKWVQRTVGIGFIFLLIAFIFYLIPCFPKHLEPNTVMQYWHVSASDFVQKTDTPIQWEWVSKIGLMDMLSFASLILLAFSINICLFVLIIYFFRVKNVFYTLFIAIQLLVLLLAASGFIH